MNFEKSKNFKKSHDPVAKGIPVQSDASIVNIKDLPMYFPPRKVHVHVLSSLRKLHVHVLSSLRFCPKCVFFAPAAPTGFSLRIIHAHVISSLRKVRVHVLSSLKKVHVHVLSFG